MMSLWLKETVMVMFLKLREFLSRDDAIFADGMCSPFVSNEKADTAHRETGYIRVFKIQTL